MRSDYVLYVVAVIFFILTGIVAAMYVEQQQLWIVTTAVIGLVFVGLGISQRPKPTETVMPPAVTTQTPLAVSPPPPPTQAPVVVEETVKEQIVEPITETAPAPSELTKVKGIGERRAQQLKTIGINTLQELANASRKEIAAKLQISPKITGKWIDNAKELGEKQ